ncbi:MAG: hypothetical protein IJ708_09395, partial [Clostridia bacterium]|nr:hypothetical protein [Clostridia bacterium]
VFFKENQDCSRRSCISTIRWDVRESSSFSRQILPPNERSCLVGPYAVSIDVSFAILLGEKPYVITD